MGGLLSGLFSEGWKAHVSLFFLYLSIVFGDSCIFSITIVWVFLHDIRLAGNCWGGVCHACFAMSGDTINSVCRRRTMMSIPRTLL